MMANTSARSRKTRCARMGDRFLYYNANSYATSRKAILNGKCSIKYLWKSLMSTETLGEHILFHSPYYA